MTENRAFQQAVEILLEARGAVAFTGAGVSAESGIPTFRGEGGIWKEVPPEEFGTPWGIAHLIRTAPERLFKMLRRIGEILLSAEPNPAHKTLGSWEEKGILKGVVTQNVDDLHELGGTKNIYKLHGDLFRWRCLTCGAIRRFQRKDLQELLERITRSFRHLFDLLELLPHCEGCGALMRPDVVLFGEPLPPQEVAGALHLLEQCDVLLVIGTSGVVEPAAGMARMVHNRGGILIEVNLEPGALTPYSQVHLFGEAGEILPALGEEAMKTLSCAQGVS